MPDNPHCPTGNARADHAWKKGLKTALLRYFFTLLNALLS
jgi:hypothetical protein